MTTSRMGVALGLFAFGLFGLLPAAAAQPPDISGSWHGPEWGDVELTPSGTETYAGSYTDTFGKRPGEIRLTWSLVERRFHGTWREASDRFGELSVRRAGEEIRGAFTTDARSKINPSTPRLADLTWTRKQGAAAKSTPPPPAPTEATFCPVVEWVLPQGVPCREQYFQFRSGKVFVVGNGPGTSEAEAAIDERRIDDAGGVDMTAGSSAELIHITGRGCFFTRDVNELKWEKITAEQVLHAIRRAGFVEGAVTPRKNELPIAYLFKTAGGDTGIIEVLGAADGGGAGRGMKFRYKLVQGTGTTTAARAAPSPLVFGPESQGLQAALEVTPGEPIKLRIHVRNVSDRDISLNGTGYRQEDECLLSDAQGRPVPVTRVTHDIRMGMKGGFFAPGQVAVFESAGLSLQGVDKASAAAGYVAQVEPGRYTVRVRLRLPGDDIPFAADAGVWRGELETGPAPIEVQSPSPHTPTSVADSPFSAILGPAIERTVNDLETTHENCALSFDSGKLLSVPSHFTLDTFTRPATETAVAWARDNQVDAVAFITTVSNKVVKCGLYGPGLVIIRANNKQWDPDSVSPRELKEAFDQAMKEWGFIPQIAELSCDADFPTSFMILDTRTHRRGVLQITGVADNPRGVKIRYRLVEGAPVKKGHAGGDFRRKLTVGVDVFIARSIDRRFRSADGIDRQPVSEAFRFTTLMLP